LISRRSFLTGVALLPLPFSAPPVDLLIGDSEAYVLAPRMRKDWSARGAVLVPRHHGGTSLRQWLRKGWAINAMNGGEYRFLLVSLGVNCVKQERKTFARDAEELVHVAEGRVKEVVWLLPPPIKFSTEYITDGAALSGATPFYPGDDVKTDGVHPTPQGALLWSSRIAEFVFEYVARS
jgi:hypothetical protein